MNLYDALLDSVRYLDYPIKRVITGESWTMVESKYTGIAFSRDVFQNSASESYSNFIGQSSFELAQGIKSADFAGSCLGMAALNSMIEPDGRTGNLFGEIFKAIKNKTVTIVGRFPLNAEIKLTAGRAYILEKNPEMGELPADECEEVIPDSDIVVISASALVNKTMPRLLELSAHAKTYIIGPSSPMNDVLLKWGADVIGGIRVIDTDALADSISKGARRFGELNGIEAMILHNS